MFGLKKLALREIAEKFPLETMPKTGDLVDILTGDICGTIYYIEDLKGEFGRLVKPSRNVLEVDHVRYVYAYYALRRLIKLTGLPVTFDSRYKFRASLSFTFSAKAKV